MKNELSNCCDAEMDELTNCKKCGKWSYLSLVEKQTDGAIRIKPNEEKIFEGNSFTLEADGDDLIATPAPMPPIKKILEEIDNLVFQSKESDGIEHVDMSYEDFMSFLKQSLEKVYAEREKDLVKKIERMFSKIPAKDGTWDRTEARHEALSEILQAIKGN